MIGPNATYHLKLTSKRGNKGKLIFFLLLRHVKVKLIISHLQIFPKLNFNNCHCLSFPGVGQLLVTTWLPNKTCHLRLWASRYDYMQRLNDILVTCFWISICSGKRFTTIRDWFLITVTIALTSLLVSSSWDLLLRVECHLTLKVPSIYHLYVLSEVVSLKAWFCSKFPNSLGFRRSFPTQRVTLYNCLLFSCIQRTLHTFNVIFGQ